MRDSPASITGEISFPHKAEVASALAAGAHVRRDERDLVANALLGAYQIRLRIAQDARPANEHTQLAEQDLSFLVDRLGQHPNVRVLVWYIHAPNGTRYHSWRLSSQPSRWAVLLGPSNYSFQRTRYARR